MQIRPVGGSPRSVDSVLTNDGDPSIPLPRGIRRRLEWSSPDLDALDPDSDAPISRPLTMRNRGHPVMSWRM
jgi:hypothetical protein